MDGYHNKRTNEIIDQSKAIIVQFCIINLTK